MTYIYKFTNWQDGKIYIGSTNTVSRRIKHHRHVSKHINNPFYNAVRKYGWSSFLFQIVEECCPLLRNDRENYWINYWHTLDREFGYNLQNADSSVRAKETIEKLKKYSGSNSKCFGKPRSEETKRKISETRIKNGVHITEETRKKLSETSKGRKPRLGMKNKEESNRKNRESNLGPKNAMYGKTHTEDARRKMSEASKRFWTDNSEEGERKRLEFRNKVSSAQKQRRENERKANRDKVQKLF